MKKSLKRKYVRHLIDSIENAYDEQSRCSNETLQIDGMSTPKVRHFINNLCSMDRAKYLEIGSFKGSTFCSAIDNNLNAEATCIENFSQFTDRDNLNGASNKDILLQNITATIKRNAYEQRAKLQLIVSDFMSVDKSRINGCNIYFYDGAHDASSQYHAFTHMNDVFENVFIAVIDDWFCGQGGPQKGTFDAFKQLNYRIHYIEQLPLGPDLFHGGLGVMVIEK
jgi:hypothetical protein